MLLEICATSVESAVNAQKGGAQRIELCSELAVGGITPSYGLLQAVLKKVSLPVFVLIRPRSGNFVYSDEEFEIIKNDIRISKELGCAGIVSGVLKDDFSVDLIRTKELVELAKPLEFTFHRAFDLTPNPTDSLEELMEIGVNRILTSGQENSAEMGIDLLKKLKDLAKDGLIILPGGGISVENLHLFKENEFMEIHASASYVWKENPKPKIPMNSEKFFDETKLFVSDEEKIIKELIDVLVQGSALDKIQK